MVEKKLAKQEMDLAKMLSGAANLMTKEAV
jgi:hypothetical protein